MSKLDNIILDCVNKALDGKQEKLGDYIDPTKQEIKDLIRHDIIKAYSSYPSHYRVEDVLADQLERVDEI